jgi:hypothetical protein
MVEVFNVLGFADGKIFLFFGQPAIKKSAPTKSGRIVL